jgi:hypothetical protein
MLLSELLGLATFYDEAIRFLASILTGGLARMKSTVKILSILFSTFKQAARHLRQHAAWSQSKRLPKAPKGLGHLLWVQVLGSFARQ